MNPGLRARALLAAGLVLCSAVLLQRLMDLRKSVSDLETTAVAFGSGFDVPQPGSASSSSARLSVELGSEDIFGRSAPEPIPEIKPVKAPEPPPPPTFSYRYFGRVQAKHFLERDGQLIHIEAGTALQDGFEILTIDERQVLARHKPTGMPVTISLPTLRE